MPEVHQRNRRFGVHPWQVAEESFDPRSYAFGQGALALANGYMGQRAAFEEGITCEEALDGTYVAGVFDAYPSPTMIKLKGRPSAPLEMVTVPDFLPVGVQIDGQRLDLAACDVLSYRRVLHMDRGVLTRQVTCRTAGGAALRLATERFLCRSRRHLAGIRVSITALGGAFDVRFDTRVNGAVANLRHRHLRALSPVAVPDEDIHGVTCETCSTGIRIAVLAAETVTPAMGLPARPSARFDHGCSQRLLDIHVGDGATVTLTKLVAVATSRDIDGGGCPEAEALAELRKAVGAGVDALLADHQAAWQDAWRDMPADVTEGSGTGEITQGLRYCLFQMLQNAPAGDPTVNIGAKGLTGEHYFGTYFWDTEVYMLPLFALTAPEVARELVRSRAHMLPAARRKAREMGLQGAAFAWMADPEGDESCTLWQFSLLAIHVTADVAWGVWFYYCVTGDLELIAECGIDIMVETSRFWAARVHRHGATGQYVINRVLGPDEYHQGVDNNFYTNLMAQENLAKTCRLLAELDARCPAACRAARERLSVTDAEVDSWGRIADGIRLPRDDALGISLQDDHFLDLEPHDLQHDPPDGAICLAWSYDRCMRTQLLRQADVVVAHLLAGDRFSDEQVARDYAFYEPRTTHDSSLSFCSHAIIAAQIGRLDQAREYFLRTVRLDLDDMHGNTWMGVHTACLGGAWQCLVLGFGRLRWYDGQLSLAPVLPDGWDAYSFGIRWHGRRLTVRVGPREVVLKSDSGQVQLALYGRLVNVGPTELTVSLPTGAEIP